MAALAIGAAMLISMVLAASTCNAAASNSHGVTAAQVPAYNYLGCFPGGQLPPRRGAAGGLSLPTRSTNQRLGTAANEGSMSPRLCARLAAAAGYQLFGVTQGNVCLGLADLLAVVTARPSGPVTCSMVCADRSARDVACGGQYAASVFVLRSDNSPGYTALGCWAERLSDPALPTLLGRSSSSMTPARCHKESSGFDLFGLRNGSECVAGRSLVRALRHGRPGQGGCNLACPGDRSRRCGGRQATQLFVRDAPPPAIPLPTQGSAASQVFIGCFKDPGPAGLPDLLFRGGSSAAECGAWARRAGNRVWGLVGAGSSRECRAGWDAAAAVAAGTDGAGCGAPCREGLGRCGGAGTVGLWKASG